METNTDISISTIDNDLSDTAIASIAKHATSLRFKKNEDIIYKGQEISGAYIVKHGVLRVYTIDANGNEKPIYHLDADEVCVFSINCILKEIVYPAWVTVVSDTAEVLSIPSTTFYKLYEEDESVREFIVNSLSDRILDLMGAIEETSIYELEHRICNYLLRHCPNNRTLRISHQDIATSLGTAREVVSRHLKNLETEGLIILSHKKIEIVSPVELASKLKKIEL